MPAFGDPISSKAGTDSGRCIAEMDCLTGLASRSMFMHQLDQVLTQSPSATRTYAVLMLDLDNFRIINNSLGHDAGDALLIGATRRLSNTLHSLRADYPKLIDSLLVARLGGDAFGVLIGGSLEPFTARAVACELVDALSAPHHIRHCEVTARASIGVLPDLSHYDTNSDVMRDAETAMYKAKHDGRGRVVVFDHTMHEAAVKRLTIESDLRAGIRGNQFVLNYQPIIDLNSGDLRGFEALVRWQHPKHGLIPPLDFIPIAEETGLILPLGWWVIEEATRQIAEWQRKYVNHAPLNMNINLSKVQLIESTFVDDCARFIKRSMVAPNTIKFEVTESIIMDAAGTIPPVLRKLHELGLGLSMDDFGTGHSSLSCLSNFPIDVLKIDRAFIRSIEHERGFSAIVQAVITLAHNLNMEVVAEGIETLEQVAQLQALECDMAQGYLFAKPLPAAEAESLIAAGQPMSLKAI